MNLQAKIAIVTGASSGIGAAFSKMLVNEGATVYGLARSTDKLALLQKQLGDGFHPVTMDVTDYAALESWVQETFKGEHLPDVLVNNAGLGFFGNVDELPMEQWHDDGCESVSGFLSDPAYHPTYETE